MKAKAFFIIIVFCAFHPVSLFAQNQRRTASPREKADRAVEQIDASLKLEKSKRSSVQGIFTDFYSDQQKLKNNLQHTASDTRQEFKRQDFQAVRRQNEALLNKRDNRLKEALTEQQYRKWKSSIEPALKSASRRE
ncbi:MAG: hypothetical protein QM640_11675 [Niabella sp.]